MVVRTYVCQSKPSGLRRQPNILPALRFIKDAARYPVFDEEEFAGEKANVIAELDRNLSQPGYYLNQESLDRLFYKYPTR